MSEAANDYSRAGFEIRQDGHQFDRRGTYDEALAIARELKRSAPEMLITVWDLSTGRGEIVQEL